MTDQTPAASATTTRAFHLSDILTITTGILVSTRHIEGVYDILGFMTGESLYTHQLPRASEECRPVLLAQHPQLADLLVPELNKDTYLAWVAEQVARFGETLPVAPLDAREAEYDTPIADLIEMVGDPTKVTVVDL